MMWKIFLLVTAVAPSIRDDDILALLINENSVLGLCYIDPGLELMNCVDEGGDLDHCAAQYVLPA